MKVGPGRVVTLTDIYKNGPSAIRSAAVARGVVRILMEHGWVIAGEHPKAKHELFNSSIEVITGICQTPDDAVADLKTTLLELKPLLDERGLLDAVPAPPRVTSCGRPPSGASFASRNWMRASCMYST